MSFHPKPSPLAPTVPEDTMPLFSHIANGIFSEADRAKEIELRVIRLVEAIDDPRTLDQSMGSETSERKESLHRACVDGLRRMCESNDMAVNGLDRLLEYFGL